MNYFELFQNMKTKQKNTIRFGDCFHASIVVATLLNQAFILNKEEMDKKAMMDRYDDEIVDVTLPVKEKTAEINTVLESSISGVRVTKAFANENFEINRFEKGNPNTFANWPR